MSKLMLTDLTKKQYSNASKGTNASSDSSHFNCEEQNVLHHKCSLSVLGERMEIIPLPAKQSKDRISNL